jgi:hypothetical protein
MNYEIKTPDLKRSRDVSDTVINGLLGGTMDVKTANAIMAAAHGLIRSVGTDIKARLALPGLIEAEAKLVESTKKAQQGAIEAQGNG